MVEVLSKEMSLFKTIVQEGGNSFSFFFIYTALYIHPNSTSQKERNVSGTSQCLETEGRVLLSNCHDDHPHMPYAKSTRPTFRLSSYLLHAVRETVARAVFENRLGSCRRGQ